MGPGVCRCATSLLNEGGPGANKEKSFRAAMAHSALAIALVGANLTAQSSPSSRKPAMPWCGVDSLAQRSLAPSSSPHQILTRRESAGRKAGRASKHRRCPGLPPRRRPDEVLPLYSRPSTVWHSTGVEVVYSDLPFTDSHSRRSCRAAPPAHPRPPPRVLARASWTRTASFAGWHTITATISERSRSPTRIAVSCPFCRGRGGVPTMAASSGIYDTILRIAAWHPTT